MAVSRSSMYKGLSVSLMRTSFQNMILFSLFEYTKAQINNLETWLVLMDRIIELLKYYIWRGGRLRLRRFHLLLFARVITQISMCIMILYTYKRRNGSVLFIVWTFCIIYYSHTTRSLVARDWNSWVNLIGKHQVGICHPSNDLRIYCQGVLLVVHVTVVRSSSSKHWINHTSGGR